jgi:hypothetical protein
MASKLLLFMFSYFGVMAIGPALFLLADFVFKINIDKLFTEHPFGVCLTIALYVGFVVLMFFCLQDVFIVFKPAPGITPLSKEALVGRLEKTFNSPVEGKRLFDFMKDGNRIVITWSSSIDYFQITSGGATGKKRVVVLTLDEKRHNVFFIMKDKDWQWNLSKNFFEASLSYSTGIFAEFSTEYRPSIGFSENGGLKVDIKKLTYDSDELWLPIQTAVLSSGWTAKGGMFPIFYHRLLLAIPLSLIVFFMLYPLMRGTVQSKGTPGKEATLLIAKGQDYQSDVAAQIEKVIPNLTTENIQSQLEKIMENQKNFVHHVNPYVKTAFTVYANSYLSKKNRKIDFESKIMAFAKENGIGNLKK